MEDDYTGTDIGYMVEYDGYYTDERNMPNGDGDPTFELSYNGFAPLLKPNGGYLYPEWGQRGYTVKSDIYGTAQLDFIQRYMENAYRIAYEAVYNRKFYRMSDDGAGIVPTSGTARSAVSAVIDVQSLADTYILNEIACDPDIAWSSFYITLDMTEGGSHKLIFEAPWDFDSAFGIRSGFTLSSGMYAANSDNPWLLLLVREGWFQTIVKEKWAALVENGVTDTALELIETQKTVYADQYAKNLERWPGRLYGDGELTWELNSCTTQEQAADYLYTWLSRRFDYLGSAWGNEPSVPDEPFTPGDGYTRHRFEAEDCSFGYPIAVDNWYGELASGGYFLGQIDGNAGTSISFTMNVGEDTAAHLSVGLSKRAFSADFNEWFSVSLNGEPLFIPARTIPACEYGETEWVAWTDVYLLPIELKAGANTLTFTTVSWTATNIDYFDVYLKTA